MMNKALRFMPYPTLFFILTVLLFASTAPALADDFASESDDQRIFMPMAMGVDFENLQWTEVNADAPWAARAGLQIAEIAGDLYLMGGRTPNAPSDPPLPGDSIVWSDVWKSTDLGVTWEEILPHDTPGHWPSRAYFQALTLGDKLIVLGGQDFTVIENPDCPPFPSECPPFISLSNFFNDVWSSANGVDWTQLTADAGWMGRAGLSAVVYNDELYVMGGSFNDDPGVIGGPPVRVFFNDVWKSSDGVTWEEVTKSAPWAPRAGGEAVVFDDYIYLLGGEDGFICLPGGRCPPYYNDVWRTQDGANWELVVEEADWPPRPGHRVVTLLGNMVLFGGFGLSPDPQDPFAFANPMDIWVSKDGAAWTQVSDSPWNAKSPEEIKYDFDALGLENVPDGQPPTIITAGGDRETFDFADPENYLRVDNDVWHYKP